MSESTAVATTTSRDLVTMDFVQALEVYTPQFEAELPSHIPVERFKRTIITAVNLNPELRKADRRSLFNAAVKCAHDGLYPDGREAALVAYGTQIVYLPMIAGIRKRMRNSGEVLSATAEVVYRQDKFRYIKGENPHIEHEPPSIEQDRGEAVGAYAIIKLTNGEVLREVMTKADMDKIKSVSRSGRNGPWSTWPEEMWRKSVLRRCAKQAPANSDLSELMAREDEPEDRPASAREIPPRPTRQQFLTHEAEEDAGEDKTTRPDAYEVIDSDGVVCKYDDLDEAADAWGALLRGVETADQFQALWDANISLIDAFVAAGRDDLETEISQIPRPSSTPDRKETVAQGLGGPQPQAGEPRSLAVELRKPTGRPVDYEGTRGDMCALIMDLASTDECAAFLKANRVTLAAMRANAPKAHEQVEAALVELGKRFA